jgi:uroporphyrinogen decarboxylase
VESVPDDVCDIWEMDRAAAGWFFNRATWDDWGCRWARTEKNNMGQVVESPLANWSALDDYRPPDPTNAFYFERIEPELRKAGDRYVAVTSHFCLFERLHMLHGFAGTMQDFYLEPKRIHRVLDMVLDFTVRRFAELHRRFENAIHGIFITDDWGTQQGTFVRPETFEEFFAERYRQLFDVMHDYGWHVILHSCGRVNAFVPRLIELGVDVLNMQQPQCYGLVEFGEQFRGKVCFLTTADIQSTLPRGKEQEVREEVRQLVRHWSTPDGGLIVFNYGDPEALAVTSKTTRVMFDEFATLAGFWQKLPEK